MASNWLATFMRHQRSFEWSLLVFTLALFLFSLVDWLDLISYEGFQPLRMVLLSAAIALQPISALMRRRSLRLSYVLLACSMVLIVGSFIVAS